MNFDVNYLIKLWSGFSVGNYFWHV